MMSNLESEQEDHVISNDRPIPTLLSTTQRFSNAPDCVFAPSCKWVGVRAGPVVCKVLRDPEVTEQLRGGWRLQDEIRQRCCIHFASPGYGWSSGCLQVSRCPQARQARFLARLDET